MQSGKLFGQLRTEVISAVNGVRRMKPDRNADIRPWVQIEEVLEAVMDDLLGEGQPKEDRAQVNFRIGREALRKMKLYSIHSRTGVSQIIRDALCEYFEKRSISLDLNQ